MTKYSLTIGFIFALCAQVFAGTSSIINQFEEDKYTADESYQHMAIPVNFGESVLLNPEQLKTLDANLVYQIDLVYTNYKTSQNFDQEALNKNRIKQLKNQLNDIDREAPTWNAIAQTGAKDATTARTFFHGFVIYYRPKKLDSDHLRTTFETYRNAISHSYQIDNAKGGTFTHPSGSTITIPPNAVAYQNGKAVEGDYQVQYTEYRNAADMALSGINMMYKTAQNNHQFSSIGMYEIRGEKDGVSLELQKSITVDFNCTAIVNDASFYQLDDQTNEWKEIRPIAEQEFGAIDEKPELRIEENAVVIAAPFENIGWFNSISQGMEFNIKRNPQNIEECEVTLNKKGWNSFTQLRGKQQIDTLCERIDEENYRFYTKAPYLKTLSNSIFSGKYTWVDNNEEDENIGKWQAGPQFEILDDGNRQNATLLGEGINKGHTYPQLVKGLNTPEFGVYNCDQIYRLKNLETIHPSYVDAETGRKITDGDVMCVMDLNYNGSFSFDPEYVTLNPEGKNALLLVTKNKETYILLPEDFEKISFDTNKPEIALKNVTEILKSSDDLKRMLNL